MSSVHQLTVRHQDQHLGTRVVLRPLHFIMCKVLERMIKNKRLKTFKLCVLYDDTQKHISYAFFIYLHKTLPTNTIVYLHQEHIWFSPFEMVHRFVFINQKFIDNLRNAKRAKWLMLIDKYVINPVREIQVQTKSYCFLQIQ